MDEMIEHCAQFVDEVNKNLPQPITKEEYIGQMKQYFPHLKRWRKELTIGEATPENPALAGVKDLITMAGGLEEGAALDRVEVFRLNLEGKEAKMTRIPLSVDENFNPTEPFSLQPYDHLVVRMKTNFGQSHTIQINGRVHYPGVYVLEDSRTQLSEIIAMAGSSRSKGVRIGGSQASARASTRAWLPSSAGTHSP